MTLTSPFGYRLSMCCAALLASSAFGENPAPQSAHRYVLFGFAPFAGRQENASWQSVKQFAEGTQVGSCEVPVVWGAPRTKLLEVTKTGGKFVLVGLGEGGGSYEVETVGFNERGNIRDEAGSHPSERAIVVDGEARLELTGSAQQLAEKLSAGGFPARISTDAGRFLCNEMLYELLRVQRENSNVAAVYFIHVPVLGSEVIRGAEKVLVSREYCAEFGRVLQGALRELHPLVEGTTASVR